MGKKLRSPLIKPRLQGGSFYTFGSAIEDIGLNINEKSNRVELTHYALIDIPAFTKNDLFFDNSGLHRHYDAENAGDLYFADAFQNYVLNLETITRNQDDYNFAISKTCSEKIFWKWLRKVSNAQFDRSGDYFYESGNNTIVKGFGQISAGSQRSDDYGVYNETFVQIPSSYGQMPCYFKIDSDENFNTIKESLPCGEYIENIKDTEIDNNGYIKTTGISAKAVSDRNNSYDLSSEEDSMLSLVLNINDLRSIYGDDTLTYDDIGFGVDTYEQITSYEFNAILVYYSIFDNNNNVLATNLYGIYIINKAVANNNNTFKFPSLVKKKTTQTESGTSFSFRINIKPTSAYSGDITVIDNSTSTYSLSEDFNDVLRNLDVAIRTLANNAKTMYDLAQSNKSIQQLATQAIDKVNDLEITVNNIKHRSSKNEKLIVNTPINDNLNNNISKDTAKEILNVLSTSFDFKNGDVMLAINTPLNNLPENVQSICKSLYTEIDGKQYLDILKILMILVVACR